jgi:Domain of unknown function (DUF6362)
MDKTNQGSTDTWTSEAVAARFEEAAKTARNLPPVRVQGYFSVWPRIVREQWVSLSGDEKSSYRAPPTPEATARMQEVMRWVQCLEVEERHLVWMRASKERWRTVATRLGVCIKTAQRRHEKALAQVATMLNHSNTPTVTTVSSSRHTGLRPSIFEL